MQLVSSASCGMKFGNGKMQVSFGETNGIDLTKAILNLPTTDARRQKILSKSQFGASVQFNGNQGVTIAGESFTLSELAKLSPPNTLLVAKREQERKEREQERRIKRELVENKSVNKEKKNEKNKSENVKWNEKKKKRLKTSSIGTNRCMLMIVPLAMGRSFQKKVIWL